MKIVLCFPPTLRQAYISIIKAHTSHPPLGLGYLASSLEQAGHKVKIIDSAIMQYNHKDIYRKGIKNFDPDVVGVSSFTASIYDSLNILKNVKKNLPNCLTVLGGSHPTALGKEILNDYPYVDVIIRGEGEKTFVDLLEKKKRVHYSKVRGILYRDKNRVIENEPRKRIKNLDSLPFPAYHLLPMEKYSGKYNLFNLKNNDKNIKPAGRILTSRGCPYNCTFCSSHLIWGGKVYMRKPEKIVEELKLLTEKYNRKFIEISDETFTICKKRIEKISSLIKKEKIDISFTCGTRTNIFNKDIACLLKKFGCEIVFFGFESGVQTTLEFLNKKLSITDSIAAVKNAKDAGLAINGNFIIGVPGETKEKINQTISFAKKLDIEYVSFTLLTPYPGTKIYEFAERNNLFTTKDWSKYNGMNPIIKIPNIGPVELKLYLYKGYLVTRDHNRLIF